MLLAMTILIIYLVLGILYESFIPVSYTHLSAIAAGDAESAILQKGQPCRSAGLVSLSRLDPDADFEGRRICRGLSGRADFDGQRRRAAAGDPTTNHPRGGG